MNKKEFKKNVKDTKYIERHTSYNSMIWKFYIPAIFLPRKSTVLNYQGFEGLDSIVDSDKPKSSKSSTSCFVNSGDG